MPSYVESEFIGKYAITSHFTRCPACQRLTLLSSYYTIRFIKLFGLPVLPTAHYRILDECAHCGMRGTTSAHRYAKERKRHLAQMMKSFANEDEAENPETCCHALQTLMIYDEANWFRDVQKSYGLRFDTNARVQHMIARGLCRFGNYDQAAIQCRKALVLGAGDETQQLLDFCLTLQEADYEQRQIERFAPAHESCIKAFIPMGVVAALLIAGLASFAVSSMRTYRAWVVNGSLSTYPCTIEEQQLVLEPGDREEIQLKLGESTLEREAYPDQTFSYNLPFFRQLFARQLMVINPDAMALIEVAAPDDQPTGNKRYVYGEPVHLIDGEGLPWLGFRKQEDEQEASRRITLYRPSTHQAMVDRLLRLEMPDAAVDYARKALLMQPATPEAPVLFDTALNGASDAFKTDFLRKGMDGDRARLNWHIRYQNHMLTSRPDYPLIKEYTTRCKESPDDSLNYYLLARLLPDRGQARQFLQHAERNGTLNGLGYAAMAQDFFYAGRYDEALESIKQALEQDPTRSDFRALHEQILLARRDFDELLNQRRLAEARNPELHDPFKTVLYLTLAGYHREAEEAALEQSRTDSASLPQLHAVRFYAVGNLDYYFEGIRDAELPNAELQVALHEDRLEAADAWLLQEDAPSGFMDHLVLYSAAMRAEKTEMAERHMKQALEADDLADPAAALLQKDEAPEIGDVLRLELPLQHKAVLLTALGFRHPEERADFHAQARRCNVMPSYPQLLIRKYTTRASAR